MTLKDAFAEHLVPGQQGQLVIKFAGDVHLCKILVDDGRAVHISHGRLSLEDILASLKKKTVEWVNFIAGYPVRKKLDFPLHENLFSAVNNTQPAVTEPAAPAPEAPAQAAPGDGPMVSPQKIDQVIESFIDLVGPLGSLLADQAAKAVGYEIGSPMPQSSYKAFINALSKEVPENERDAFFQKFKS